MTGETPEVCSDKRRRKRRKRRATASANVNSAVLDSSENKTLVHTNGTKPIQGYCSKKKIRQWSLNMIHVLQHCQGQVDGKLLIALPYLLFKEAGEVGSPEKPRLGHCGESGF